MEKKKKKRILLIIMHLVIAALLAVAFVLVAKPAGVQVAVQDTDAVEELADEPLPGGISTPATTAQTTETAAPTASATATAAPSATATVAPSPTPSPTPAPTTTTTPRPTTTTTPAPTTSPTPSPSPSSSPSPSPSPTPTDTPEPTPEFTYSVSNKDGVAPAGYTFVFVTVTPDGSYTVKYSGTTMTKSSGKYYLMVAKLESGNYRSKVSVTKN